MQESNIDQRIFVFLWVDVEHDRVHRRVIVLRVAVNDGMGVGVDYVFKLSVGYGEHVEHSIKLLHGDCLLQNFQPSALASSRALALSPLAASRYCFAIVLSVSG